MIGFSGVERSEGWASVPIEKHVSAGWRGPLKRLCAAIGLLAISLLVVRSLAELALAAIDKRNGLGDDLSGQLTQLAIASLTTALPLLFVCGVFVALRWFRAYRPTQSSIRKFWWGFIWLFLPLLLLFLAAIGVGSLHLEGVEPEFGHFNLLWAALVVGKIFLSALLEEVVFRGVLIEQMRALWPQSVLAVVVSAILFGLSHDNSDVDQLLARTIMGIGLGWSAVRLGGIAFPIGAHFGINLGVALLSPGFGMNPVIDSQAAMGPGDGGVTGYWQGGLAYCVLIVVASEVIRFRSRAMSDIPERSTTDI